MNNLIIAQNYATYGEAGLKSNQIIYYKEDDFFKMRTNLADDPFAPSQVVTLVKEGAGGGGLDAVLTGKSTHYDVPSDMTYIQPYLFSNTGVESVDFDHLITITLSSFQGSSISRINSEEEGTLDLSLVSGFLLNYAFKNTPNVKKVIIDTNNLTTMQMNCFEFSGVEEVIFIGSGLLGISSYAFKDSKLKSIDLSQQTDIDNPYVTGALGIQSGAFKNCTELTEIKLPPLRSITNSMLNGCSKLTHIDIPVAVTSFANDACSNTPFEIVNFGNTRTTIPSISSTSFTMNENLKFVVPDALLDQWKAANVWKNTNIVSHIYPYSEIYNE